MSLNEISGFTELVRYFDENRDKPRDQWLEINKLFNKQGKQGLTGLMTSSDGSKTYVFKLSQYINYLAQHELSIMKSLNSLGSFCPHFCKGVGAFLAEVEPDCRRSTEPFTVKNKYPIEKEILLMEYLKGALKFSSYINHEDTPEKILYSTVKQTLLAIAIAQRKKKFTHYDLHSNNIMMKKCDKDLVMLYVLDDENQFLVATNGYYPVIIDYGFSYTQDMDDKPMWATMGHTHCGFTSDHFDPIADPKLFLVITSGEINDARKSKNSRKFKNIVKNIFSKLTIDFRQGWDNDLKKPASDVVTSMFKNYNSSSELFDRYAPYCLDIIQTLVILPLEEQKYSEVDVPYRTFINEFVKIEREIGNPFYNMYILKGVVDAAQQVRVDYMRKESREHALKYFRQVIYERIDKIAKWCKPKDVQYEKMLCGLLCLSRGIEGVFFDILKGQKLKKEHEYQKMPLRNIEQMYAAIDVNIPDRYKFSPKTTVMVLNANTEDCDIFKPTKDLIRRMNSTESICRGTELYGIYKKSQK